jgi:hypothetical protein
LNTIRLASVSTGHEKLQVTKIDVFLDQFACDQTKKLARDGAFYIIDVYLGRHLNLRNVGDAHWHG